MLRPLILFLFFTLSCCSLFAQMVTIRGQANDYAGKDLIFYTFPEPISHQKKRLAETKIAQDGAFILTFKIDETIEVYADLEKYKGTLVAEPGVEYQISLPAYSPRSVQEAASPYFEPELYWFGIKGIKPSELNFLVRAFLTDYNKELNSHTLAIYQKRSVDSVKAIIARLEAQYPTGKDHYLNTLKTYTYGELEFAVAQPEKEKTIQKYFATKEVSLSHPAYQHLFSSIFSDYLNLKYQDIRQKGFVSPALQGDFEGFVNKMTTLGYKKELAELVAVKCFYDGFYSNKFNKQLMLKGLDQAEDKSTFEPLKETLPEIIKKITSLQEGNAAPSLSLKNANGETHQLAFGKKFIYLAFFRSDSKSCMAELDSLITIDKKLNTVLTIMPISLDQNFANAIKFWNEKKYPWELTGAADTDKIRKDYQIKSLPAFYLISPQNKLVLSPALAPSHNFESLFLKIFREQKFRQKVE